MSPLSPSLRRHRTGWVYKRVLRRYPQIRLAHPSSIPKKVPATGDPVASRAFSAEPVSLSRRSRRRASAARAPLCCLPLGFRRL